LRGAVLSEQWPKCLAGDARAFYVISAFHRVLRSAAAAYAADVVLIDVGPNLGAINRAAVLAAAYVVIPVAADLFALRGLINLGPTLRAWRSGWEKRLGERPQGLKIALPEGRMQPAGYIAMQHAGYIAMQHAIVSGRPTKAYRSWMQRIPGTYREYVLGEENGDAPSVEDDPYCLAMLKHYRSLMPMAQDARKPIFHLTAADGAIGAHTRAVRACYSSGTVRIPVHLHCKNIVQL
jgi:hypothetical protein